jgi:hypothetical protein
MEHVNVCGILWYIQYTCNEPLSRLLGLFVQTSPYDLQGRRNWGEGGAAAPVALYQEGEGGQRCPFNLKDCLGEIANCQKC